MYTYLLFFVSSLFSFISLWAFTFKISPSPFLFSISFFLTLDKLWESLSLLSLWIPLSHFFFPCYFLLISFFLIIIGYVFFNLFIDCTFKKMSTNFILILIFSFFLDISGH
jgi:hypothetical protein